MKKAILLLIVITFVSCSSDESTGSSNKTSINPPAWIQGTWLSSYNNTSTGSGFKFSKDDLCLVVSNTLSSCNKETLSVYNNSIFTNVDETISDSEYIIIITISSVITTYHFKKISNSKIEWVVDNGFQNLYTKQ
jgi:hypothetical protein